MNLQVLINYALLTSSRLGLYHAIFGPNSWSYDLFSVDKLKMNLRDFVSIEIVIRQFTSVSMSLQGT